MKIETGITCGHKARDVTPSIAWSREALKEEALDDLPSKDERGPSSVTETNIGTVSKATLGKILSDRVESIGAFPSGIDTVLK